MFELKDNHYHIGYVLKALQRESPEKIIHVYLGSSPIVIAGRIVKIVSDGDVLHLRRTDMYEPLSIFINTKNITAFYMED